MVGGSSCHDQAGAAGGVVSSAVPLAAVPRKGVSFTAKAVGAGACVTVPQATPPQSRRKALSFTAIITDRQALLETMAVIQLTTTDEAIRDVATSALKKYGRWPEAK